MREPQPALVLFCLEGLALLLVVLSWLALPPVSRHLRLQAILVTEHGSTPPPMTLPAQAAWLVAHRVQRLQHLGRLGAVAGLIGVVEGWEHRRHDPYRGVGFMHFALGQLLLALTLGAVLGYVMLPWPLPPFGSAVGLGLLVGSTLFCLATGQPQIR